jgi:hypothetical protein
MQKVQQIPPAGWYPAKKSRAVMLLFRGAFLCRQAQAFYRQ